MKKTILFIISVSVILIGWKIFLQPVTRAFSSEYCAFCDQEVIERQKFYEDDIVVGLYTHKPILPGHCLIISKRHVERFEFLTEEEIVHIGVAIRKIDQSIRKVFNTSSYLLVQKNGVEVGQSVPHLHFHYIPKKEADSSIFLFVMKAILAHLKSPISHDEMGEIVEKLKTL